MSVLNIRNLALGEGKAKIAVPLVARNETGLRQALALLEHACFDLVEYRADFDEEAGNIDALLRRLAVVRAALPDVPLLFTFRTAQEGGEYPCERGYYFELNRAVAASGLADMVDIELGAADESVQETVAAIKRSGAAVLMSNHDFQATPPTEEMVSRLKNMARLGADVCKIAVMPQSSADVLNLLSATQEARGQIGKPLVSISMGRLGIISRLCGSVFGSAMTFGAVGQVSAPGQIDSVQLRRILELL